MLFGGNAQSMITSLKNNKRSRKNKFEKDITETNDNFGKIVDYKKMSPEQFETFKLKLKKNELRRQKNLAIVFGGLMLVIVSILIYFLFYH